MELWQWVVLEDSQVRTWFAAAERDFEPYQRLGEPVFASSLLVPMVFGLSNRELDLADTLQQRPGKVISYRFKAPSSHGSALKQLNVLSEFAISLSELVEAIGLDWVSFECGDEVHVKVQELDGWTVAESRRADLLMKVGVQMLGHSRGFDIEWVGV